MIYNLCTIISSKCANLLGLRYIVKCPLQIVTCSLLYQHKFLGIHQINTVHSNNLKLPAYFSLSLRAGSTARRMPTC